MKSIQPITLLFAVFTVCLFANTATFARYPAPAGALIVSVTGFKSTQGQLIVSVFRQADDLFGPPFLQQRLCLTDSAPVVTFKAVPFGRYVVFAFHDENNNGILDHNWLHLPKEPMGYSNDWHLGVFTGMPTFEKTNFIFSRENSAVTITVK